MSCSDFRDWTAVRDSMPGPNDGPVLRIDGMCTCTSGGHRVTLEPDNEGTVDDPDVVVFRVVVDVPDDGTTHMSDEAIHYEGGIDETPRWVVIRIPDAADARVEIEDVS